jgi:hypothetical protein
MLRNCIIIRPERSRQSETQDHGISVLHALIDLLDQIYLRSLVIGFIKAYIRDRERKETVDMTQSLHEETDLLQFAYDHLLGYAVGQPLA